MLDKMLLSQIQSTPGAFSGGLGNIACLNRSFCGIKRGFPVFKKCDKITCSRFMSSPDLKLTLNYFTSIPRCLPRRSFNEDGKEGIQNLWLNLLSLISSVFLSVPILFAIFTVLFNAFDNQLRLKPLSVFGRRYLKINRNCFWYRVF